METNRVLAVGSDDPMERDESARGNDDPALDVIPVEVPLADTRGDVEPQEMVPVPLSIGAKASQMKERLRELSQPVYGTKDELWARLQKAERIVREK
eukprot:4348690-Amphidinium_carterae.1